jgi:predicted negative regulator of RcsB-dependent stress response
MNDKQSAFSKKHLEEKILNEKKDILDELNLPPALAAFIRKNSLNLIIVCICIVLVILGSTYYKNYKRDREDQAAAALVTAIKMDDAGERATAVKEVVAEFAGTDASLWGRLELAHVDYQAGNFEQAVSQYKDIATDLPSDSDLLPLVTYSLGYAYEQLQDADNALRYYQSLTKMIGFAGEGYLGLGRVYEQINDSERAIDSYENYLAWLDEDPGHETSPQNKIVVEDKLAALQAGAVPAEKASTDH